MRYLLFAFMFFAGCSRQSYELEQMSEDVIKSKQGIDIQIKPLPKISYALTEF